ncbi:MAG: hypothetical protein R3C59_29705 [Planctomycetaceae bacterium]
MAKSRLSMRREVEAAEASESATSKTKKKTVKKKAVKKKATTTRTRKKKADMPARRRLVWVVYSSTMREEGRFLYHERNLAEEKLNSLLAKGKRRYFIQPIKEPLDSEGNPLVSEGEDKLRKGALPDDDDDTTTESPDLDADVDDDLPDVDVDADADVDVDDDVVVDD